MFSSSCQSLLNILSLKFHSPIIHSLKFHLPSSTCSSRLPTRNHCQTCHRLSGQCFFLLSLLLLMQTTAWDQAWWFPFDLRCLLTLNTMSNTSPLSAKNSWDEFDTEGAISRILLDSMRIVLWFLNVRRRFFETGEFRKKRKKKQSISKENTKKRQGNGKIRGTE